MDAGVIHNHASVLGPDVDDVGGKEKVTAGPLKPRKAER